MADKTVLIYEQDDKFIKALKLYFRGSSYDPVSAADPDELLQRAAAKRPDVVLVALEAGDDPDRDVVARLVKSSATAGAPIIVMSGKKDEHDLFQEGVAGVGASAYIKKPFIKKAILSLLDEVLSGAGPAPGGQPREGVDLGTVFTEIDAQIDTFFPGEQGESQPGGDGDPGEFAITLEDDGAAPADSAAGDEPIAIALDDESTAPQPDLRDALASRPAHAGGAGAPVETARERDEPAGWDAAEARRLRERIRELEEELRQKTEEFKTVAREKERVEHSIGRKESELIERIKGLEKQNEDLEEDIKKRKQLVAQMTASVAQLNEDLEAKDGKHQKEAEEWQGQIARLQAQVEEVQERSSQQAHDIEDKADEIARLTRRIADLEGERNELTGSLERMTEAKGEADRNIERLEGDLGATRDTLGRTETELATERQRIASARERLETGVAGLRETLERQMAEARAQIERGLALAGEAAEATSSGAQQTLDQSLDSLLGRS